MVEEDKIHLEFCYVRMLIYPLIIAVLEDFPIYSPFDNQVQKN